MSDQVILDRLTTAVELLSKQALHTKTPASSSNAVELHGVGSLFGSQSIERDVITAHIRPMGLGSMLRAIPTVYEDPRFASITGFTGDVGSEAALPCDDNPRAYLKACNLTAQFGRVARDTGTIEADKVMLRRNRGDFTDLILRGQLLGEAGFTATGLTDADILRVVTKAEMVTAAVSLERILSVHLWQGSPANNNAGGGYKEFPGLDRQIATGQVDADSGTACPALDSDVKDFGCDQVGGTGRDIVEYLAMLEFYLRHNAIRMGLMPVQWAIVMRPELWFVLSDVWPCAYNTNRCATVINDANGRVSVDGFRVVTERDAMRNGNYIEVNGNRYPVITDDGIFEHNSTNNANVAAGCFCSSIYMVPLTITGGFPVTYLEHVDYSAWAPDVSLTNNRVDFWSDGGRYSWAIENEKWCYKLSVKTEQRVVLRTPQLAGRIDSVGYCPLQHLRSSDPSSPYFFDGGVSLRPDETKHAVWLS
jgi:hypothetical protein